MSKSIAAKQVDYRRRRDAGRVVQGAAYGSIEDAGDIDSSSWNHVANGRGGCTAAEIRWNKSILSQWRNWANEMRISDYGTVRAGPTTGFLRSLSRSQAGIEASIAIPSSIVGLKLAEAA